MLESRRKIVPFSHGHGPSLVLQKAQSLEQQVIGGFGREQWLALEKSGPAWSGFDGNRIIGSAGVTPAWRGRAIAWCMICEGNSHADLLFATRMIHGFLTKIQANPAYRRIETPVLESFNEGHRWAKMLGFDSEGLMRCYDQQGRDVRLYARIKWAQPPSSRCSRPERPSLLEPASSAA